MDEYRPKHLAGTDGHDGRRSGDAAEGGTTTTAGVSGESARSSWAAVVRDQPIVVPLAATVVAALLWAGWSTVGGGGGSSDVAGGPGGSGTSMVDTDGDGDLDAAATVTTGSTLAPLPPFDGWVNPASSGRPWGDTVEGLLTFRGNPTRSWYGVGPMPSDPTVLWSYPGEGGGLCGTSIDGSGAQTWCGTGWTGQPSVWERDGTTWLAFGAYDYGVHALDATTGEDLLEPFLTGDIIKGSVTVDPDGFPLLYTGSRDNYLRALALDRDDEMVELWKFNAKEVGPTLWNDDWDPSPLVIDDYLFEGGENSQFHVWKLNRHYDAAGLVAVSPELVFNTPGWDQQLLDDIADTQVSIENSVVVTGDTVWFSNGGGLVQGWDIGGLKDGVAPTRTFRFWTGDDTDASLVADDEGYLYVSSEFERPAGTARTRAAEIGQIVKLDPRKPDDPVVWAVDDQGGGKSGAWGTSAIWNDMVYSTFNSGRVVGIDRNSGDVVWEKNLPGPTWQSPVVVDDVLLVGDCEGELHAYDVSDTRVDPPELWSVQLTGCIESTPAVWKGRIFVGARGGRFYAIGDPSLAPPGGPEGDPTWRGTTGEGADLEELDGIDPSGPSTSADDGAATVTTARPTVTAPGERD